MNSVATSHETDPRRTIGLSPHPGHRAPQLIAIEEAAAKRTFRRIAVCVIMALGTLAAQMPAVTPVGAQEIKQDYTIISSEPSRPENGWPAGRMIHCACYSRDDLIAVFRVQGDQAISANLDQQSDFDGTIWLIDVGNRGYYQVVVRFYRDQGSLRADYWQDHDGDGKVAIVPHDGTLQITEKGFPSIRAVAHDGYWQRDGRLAPNLDLFVDDSMPATIGYGTFLDRMVNDGHADVVIRVRGNIPNDPRSYDWRNVYIPISESSAILRTELMVRERGQEPAYPPVFPWYLLGAWYGTAGNPQAVQAGTRSRIPLETNPPYGMVKPYNKSFAPVQVDWSSGRVAIIGEFIASRGSDVNWFTYSHIRIEPGQLSNPDFESPFSFYDLADDNDGIPELEVRIERMNPDDPFNPEPQFWRGRPFQAVRYSWDQTNTQTWSYKLGLLGQHGIIDTTVSFPEFALTTIPYTAFPTWVTQHRWDLATFAATDQPFWTTEGIYLGDFGRQLRDRYYTGGSPEGTDPETMMESGWRLDYNFHYGRQPWLTYNPVDHELHLLAAEGGIWQIDDRREVRFLNSSGGDAFDGWQLWDDDALKAQLYRLPGGLLYSDATTTLYNATEIPTESFRTLPPTTTEEWNTLGDRLTANERSFAPGDLRAMFDQFGGKTTQVVAGPLRDFRHTPTGVRFAIDARTRRELRSIGKLVGARPEPGLQVLSLGPNGWSVEQGTFALPVPVIEVPTARALASTVARVTVENPGTMDLTDAVMDVEAISPEGDVALIAVDEPVAADGGGHVTLDVPWAPTGQGSWTIEALVYRDVINEWSGERPLLVTGSAKINVAGVPTVGTMDADRLGWIGAASTWPLVPLGCAVLVAAMAGTVLRFSRPTE